MKNSSLCRWTNSPIYRNVQSARDLPELTTSQIAHFSSTTRDLEAGKWVRVEGWVGPREAKAGGFGRRKALQGSEEEAAVLISCHRSPPYQVRASSETRRGHRILVILSEAKGSIRQMDEILRFAQSHPGLDPGMALIFLPVLASTAFRNPYLSSATHVAGKYGDAVCGNRND